jgi:hypothetical protein
MTGRCCVNNIIDRQVLWKLPFLQVGIAALVADVVATTSLSTRCFRNYLTDRRVLCELPHVQADVGLPHRQAGVV